METSPNSGKVGYGLDLAGYSTGKSALARAEYECPNGTVRVRIIPISEHPFARKRKLQDVLDVEPERGWIECMLAESRLCVDIPIDLQGLMDLAPLPERDGCAGTPFLWELTRRPVDYAFGALPPLADRIGSPVARFRTTLTERQRNQLGHRLWETYPREVLKRLTGTHGHYKNGRAAFDGRKWVPHPSTEKTAGRSTELARIANQIGLTASGPTSVNDDDLDAAVCAVAGVAPQWALLCGAELEKEIRCCIKEKLEQQEARNAAPRGYLLLRSRYWSGIHLTETEDDLRTPSGVT